MMAVYGTCLIFHMIVDSYHTEHKVVWIHWTSMYYCCRHISDHQLPLFKSFLPSFHRTASCGYKYHVYLAYDEDDAYILEKIRLNFCVHSTTSPLLPDVTLMMAAALKFTWSSATTAADRLGRKTMRWSKPTWTVPIISTSLMTIPWWLHLVG